VRNRGLQKSSRACHAGQLSGCDAGKPRFPLHRTVLRKRWRSAPETLVHPLGRGAVGQGPHAAIYDLWRTNIAPTGERIFGQMLELVGIGVNASGQWPPVALPDTPLVIVANHPFGIGDGIAVLSLAEKLGRPFRVMIAAELLKIKEMSPIRCRSTSPARKRR
jgi:putative hemolysin